MKKFLLWALFSLSILAVYSQTEQKPYLLYATKSSGGVLSGNKYLYNKNGSADSSQTTPAITSPDYLNYEWYFIPVGDNEPGMYYLRNGNGQYLYCKYDKNGQPPGLAGQIGEVGFKWFISKINDSTTDRIKNNTLRLYVRYNNVDYTLEINGSNKASLTKSVTTNVNAFQLIPSRDDNMVYNSDMELISKYVSVGDNNKDTVPSPTSFHSTSGSSIYFPLDYKRYDGSGASAGARLFHNHTSSGNGGYYFVRLKSGDAIEKIVDNPAITEETHFKLTVRVRATQSGGQVGVLKMLDASKTRLFSAPLKTISANSKDLNHHDANAWHLNEVYFSTDVLSETSGIRIECTMPEGELLDVDDIAITAISQFPFEKPETLYWNPSISYVTDWNYLPNWCDKDGNCGFLLDKKTKATLPSGKMAYPLLVEGERNLCSTISFEDGTQLGNQFYLNYDRAEIAFRLKTMQWYAFSAPLRGLYSGDYMFPHANPVTEMRVFKAENPQTGAYYADWTTSFATTTHQLSPAMPYSVRVGRVFYSVVDDVAGADMDSRELIDEVLFRFPKTSVSFPFYDDITKKPTGTVEYLSDDARCWSHRFVYETEVNGKMLVPEGETLLTVVPNNAGGEEIIMLGNPFMAHLDFEEFYRKNYAHIYPEFRLLINGSDYLTYSGVDPEQNGFIESFAATHDKTATGMIPPMTPFVVRTRGDYAGEGLTITKSMSQVFMPQNDAATKSKQEAIIIELIQEEEVSSAFVVPGNDYDNTYNPSEDARKVRVKGSDLKPLLYTIVDDRHLEVNRIKEFAGSLSIGVSISIDAPTRLKISNSAQLTYADELFLVDTYKGIEIPFDNNNSIDYRFDGECGNQAGRFFIVRKGSAVDSVSDDNISITKYNGSLIITSPSSLIEQIQLYDLTGRLLFKSEYSGSTASTIDISPWSNRPAIVKIQTKSGVKAAKVIL